MNEKPEEKVIVTSMAPRKMEAWTKERKQKGKPKRTMAIVSAAVFAISAGACFISSNANETNVTVMTTGFEYDETLGRLQYVSNILPESAMVFLSSEIDAPTLYKPIQAETLHAWSQAEPWLEYSATGEMKACDAGEVMTVIQNRKKEYTVRLMHQNGYESIYSGLYSVAVGENDLVGAGEIIGRINGSAGFELRRDGLSILPVFAAQEGNE